MSLARLWESQRRRSDARAHLASAYGRFTEGFQTADVKAAREFLSELSS
jgi:predicted ATPase